jgi:Raf kinase inhibitor-like YbhB/YbcL family protein
MPKQIIACAALLAGLTAFASLSFAAANGGRFTITSAQVGNRKAMANEQVLNGFGCMGGNVSPEIKWRNPPAGTKSFALQMYDPDAPTGSGWWHWVVVDIPAAAREIPKGASKQGTATLQGGGRQTRTDFGAPGYGGPCPPPGKPHRYIFTLTALNVDKLDVPNDASGALVGFNLGAHKLGTAVIRAQYGR